MWWFFLICLMLLWGVCVVRIFNDVVSEVGFELKVLLMILVYLVFFVGLNISFLMVLCLLGGC